MKRHKFLYVLLLTSLSALFAGETLSYAEHTVEQLIIINPAYNTLNFYEDGSLVRKFRCATGTSSTPTPQGKTSVANKMMNRPYFKEKIPGGAWNNPLGRRWIGLFDGDTYAIHGTNAAYSIGSNASHGCIRMHNSDVEWLYDRISIGATVIIRNTLSSDYQIAKDNNIFAGYRWKTKGNKTYFRKNAHIYATGWNKIEGKKYYFNKKGVLQTGLKTIKGELYYLGNNGLRHTGWQEIDGNKYYFKKKNNNKGKAIKGQAQINKKNYYFGEDGIMVTSKKIKIDNNYYYFGKDGVMAKSKKIKVGDNYYYFGEDGKMAISKKAKIGDDYYYFDANGVMVTSTMVKVSGKYCYFKKDGKMLKYGLLKASSVIVVLMAIIKIIISKRKNRKKNNEEKLASNV